MANQITKVDGPSMFDRSLYKPTMDEYSEDELQQLEVKLILGGHDDDRVPKDDLRTLLKQFFDDKVVLHFVREDKDQHKRNRVFTSGLQENWAHRDVECLVAYPLPTLSAVLLAIFENIQEGKKYEPEIMYDDLLENGLQHKFIESAWSCNGQEVRGLRVIFPDTKNSLLQQDMEHPEQAQYLP